MISSWFLLSFLLVGFIVVFSFLPNQENRYIIHHYLKLFYDIFNTITDHNQRQNYFLSLVPNYIFRESKNYFITLCASSVIMISVLSLFECITHSLSLSIEEIFFFTIASWIFHVSDFLRLFMKSFKYGLVSLRYSLTECFLFLSSLLSYSILLLLQKLLPLTDS